MTSELKALAKVLNVTVDNLTDTHKEQFNETKKQWEDTFQDKKWENILKND